MNKKNNQLFSIDEFFELANTHDQHCISLFIPTSRAGEPVDKKLGQLTLKNELKKLRTDLKDYQLKEHEIDNLLYPVLNLLNDYYFWRNQSDCLVIFLSQEGMKKYSLPIDQQQKSYIADHFYLLPLVPLLNRNEKFYVLSLSLQKVSLFEATAHSITYIHIEDLIPEKLEEVVGYDYEDKSLQFRTGNSGKKTAIFHGQGSGKDDKYLETEKFFKAIDNGIMPILKKESAPLILACVDHYYPIYRKITNYSNIYYKHINGNHDNTDPYMLHELAWDLIESKFKKKDEAKRKELHKNESNSKVSFDLNDIVPAAFDGKIDTLFIHKDDDRFGIYDKLNRSLIIDEDKNLGQASLFNLVATQAILKGGKVILTSKMPLSGTQINALLRY